jgi:histidine ammonia-lyase
MADRGCHAGSNRDIDMRSRTRDWGPITARLIVFTLMLASAGGAAADDYKPINPTMANETVILNGHDLTIEQVIDVARHGAHVRFSPEAIARADAGRGLLAEGNAEGIAIYGVNRGAGAQREVRHAPNPESGGGAGAPDGRGGGQRFGALPEIDEEALVRAFLVIQANHIPYNAATPEFMRMICDLLNKRVTPLMYSRGSLGEGDLMLTSNFQAPMYGQGIAYFEGRRMDAGEALRKAGLKPLTGAAGGGTTNAYATAIAALLVDEGRGALEWTDLIYAMDLLGMNSSVTPLSTVVQAKHPVPWIRWEAAKTRDILRDSYLFQDDPTRILQDPESLRAGYVRQGAAWQAWSQLRDMVTLQMNSGEQNPAVVLDASPSDSWELATPWLMKYYVKGGPASNGRHGYVVSNANWDPYPMTNEIESFNLALANMAVAVAQRIERFSDRGPTPFFTGIKPEDVLTQEQFERTPYIAEDFFTYLDVWKEMQSLTQSLPPDSNGSDVGVADIEASSRLKAARGRQAVDLHMQLLGHDLLIATYWLDIRKIQDKSRDFGKPATAAWQDFRKKLPFFMNLADRPNIPYGVTAYEFLKATPATTYVTAPPMPDGMTIPVADSPGVGKWP